MTNKLNPIICAALTAGALFIYSLPCAADIKAVNENIKAGEEICVDNIDEKGAAFDNGEKATESRASIFPATGVVINLEKIGLNVRTKPWGTILGVLPNSARVTVTGVSGEWYQIEYKGRTAYAYKTYIAINNGAQTEAVSDKDSGKSTGRISDKTIYEITADKKAEKISNGNNNSNNTNEAGRKNVDREAAGEAGIKNNDGNDNNNGNGNYDENERKNGNYGKNGEAGTKNNNDNDGKDKPGTSSAGNDIQTAGATPAEKDMQISGKSQKGGAAFMAATASLSRQAREEEIKKAVLNGNTPSFLNKFKEVRVKKVLSDGKEHTISYFAAPDYLAVGNDSDYVRTPMSPVTAQQIADKLGCMLPTAKMVDDIYAQASTKLNPQPMSSGNYPNWQNQMMKSEFYAEHQKLVQSQAAKVGHKDGELAAGHKKDIIISNSLNAHPDRVIIYGWQLKGGKNIQPLSWIHENSYADYSHGVRLIKREMIVDGVKMDSAAVLKDTVLSALLSKEGAMKDIRAAR